MSAVPGGPPCLLYLESHNVGGKCLFMTRSHTLQHKIDDGEVVHSHQVPLLPQSHLHGD